jgi:hypothetical protein
MSKDSDTPLEDNSISTLQYITPWVQISHSLQLQVKICLAEEIHDNKNDYEIKKCCICLEARYHLEARCHLGEKVLSGGEGIIWRRGYHLETGCHLGETVSSKGEGIIWGRGYHLEERVSSGGEGFIWRRGYHLGEKVSSAGEGIIWR